MSWQDEEQLRQKILAMQEEAFMLREKIVELNLVELRKWALSLSGGDMLEAEKYVGYVTNGLS